MNIENKKQFATILLAVGLGLVAAFLTSQYVQNNIQQQTKALAVEYQKKNAALIQEVELAKKEINKLAQQQASLAKQMQERPKMVVEKEKPPKVIETMAFSVVTPPGKRALTIQIDSLSAVGGLINPGDFVDIIAQLKAPEDEGKPKGHEKEITTVLFQNIQVLAVGTNFSPQMAEGTALPYEAQQKARSLNVTLALTPEEAALLTFVQDHGGLRLSLRAPAEEGTEFLQVASWDTLSQYVLDKQGTTLDLPIKPKPKEEEKKPEVEEEEKPEEEKPYIQIFRGGREF